MAKAFSVEDNNLNTSIISSKARNYKDLDLTFSPKPAGDVYKKVDAASVKQAVKNLLMTAQGEKPFQPYFGSQLGEALFDLDTDFDPEYVQNIIADAIQTFEPRAHLLRVSVQLQPDFNSIDASVEFQVVNTKEIVVVDVSLARLR